MNRFEALLLGLLTETLNQHTAYDFSDANTGPPAYVQEDADGNIQGLLFTPADYLDGINVIVQLLNFYNNIAVPTNNYGDVVSVISDV